MFIGHFAVGFAAKRWAPRTPPALTTAPLAGVPWIERTRAPREAA